MEITSIADNSGQTPYSTRLISEVSNLPETSSSLEKLVEAPTASATSSLPETSTSSLPQTSSLSETSNLLETSVEASSIPTASSLPKTSSVPETSNVPETSSLHETSNVPETSSVPKTLSVPETLSLPFGIKELARISWEGINGLDKVDCRSSGKVIVNIVYYTHNINSSAH